MDDQESERRLNRKRTRHSFRSDTLHEFSEPVPPRLPTRDPAVRLARNQQQTEEIQYATARVGERLRIWEQYGHTEPYDEMALWEDYQALRTLRDDFESARTSHKRSNRRVEDVSRVLKNLKGQQADITQRQKAFVRRFDELSADYKQNTEEIRRLSQGLEDERRHRVRWERRMGEIQYLLGVLDRKMNQDFQNSQEQGNEE